MIGEWEMFMMPRVPVTRRTLATAMVVFLGSVLLAGGAFAATARGALQALDPDRDGTVSLAEAKAAASRLFSRLDRDHDGTLDRRELRGRMVSKEFAAADRDHDGTVDRAEYLAAVEKAFRAANRDNDGTLDAKELSSAQGRALLRLLR
jgi:Ca2+-binding EF-hand superfamily protein